MTVLDKSRDWLKEQSVSKYRNDLRYHILPHQIDVEDDDELSRVVSLSIYGMVEGYDKPIDIVSETL